MAKVRSQRHAGAESEIDLANSQLPGRPDPEIVLNQIVELYERFVQRHPERAEYLLERCREMTKKYRPLGKERVLGTGDAMEFTGLSRPRINQLGARGICGERVDGHYWFSETELHTYMQSPQSVGPRLKKATKKD